MTCKTNGSVSKVYLNFWAATYVHPFSHLILDSQASTNPSALAMKPAPLR
jgi:hypothetical protein